MNEEIRIRVPKGAKVVIEEVDDVEAEPEKEVTLADLLEVLKGLRAAEEERGRSINVFSYPIYPPQSVIWIVDTPIQPQIRPSVSSPCWITTTCGTISSDDNSTFPMNTISQ